MDTTIKGTTQLDDLTLVNGIRNNNMKCYRLFQSRYFTYIKHLFARWVNDASDAEELSCDVMMKVINTIDRFDANKGNMRLWIYVIAINTRNDYLRKLAAREKAIRAAYEKVMKRDKTAVDSVTNEARRRGLETAPADDKHADVADVSVLRTAPVRRTREHPSTRNDYAQRKPLGNRAPLPVLAHPFPASMLIRRLFSYLGAIYKHCAAEDKSSRFPSVAEG